MTALIAWAGVAAALRLAMAWACADAGVLADMEQYHGLAAHLATTGRLLPDTLRGPGYPALLAGAYAIGGVSAWTARVANALVGALLTIVTGWLAVKAGAGRRAWIAAAIVAVYPALVLSSVYLLADSFYALLATASLLLLRHRSRGYAAAAGVVAGLAILTRSVGLALVGVAGVLVLWDLVPGRTRRGTPPPGASTATVSLSRFGAFVAACLVALLPWLVFTSRVAGGPLLDATSGMNVLLGNNDTATGRLRLGDDAALHETYVSGAASVADGSARALRAGVAWAWTHPAATARLSVSKLAYLFGLEGREHAWAYGRSYFGPRASAVVTTWGVLLIVAFPALVLAAAWGVARAPMAWDRVHVAMGGFVVATAALHLVSFGESRFHLPLVPVLAVAASLGGGRVSAASAISAPARAVRRVAAVAIVAVLALGWAGQFGELAAALTRLRAPDGWTSAIPY